MTSNVNYKVPALIMTLVGVLVGVLLAVGAITTPAQAVQSSARCIWDHADGIHIRVCLRVWHQDLAGNDVRVTRHRICASAPKSGYYADMHNIDSIRERAGGKNVHTHYNKKTDGWCWNDHHNTMFPGAADVKVGFTVGVYRWPDDRYWIEIRVR